MCIVVCFLIFFLYVVLSDNLDCESSCLHQSTLAKSHDDLDVIDLPRITLSKLLYGDQAEAAALFNAGADLGFFLLDLGHTIVGETLMKESFRR